MEDQRSVLLIEESQRLRIFNTFYDGLEMLHLEKIRSPKICWIFMEDEEDGSSQDGVIYTPVLKFDCDDYYSDEDDTEYDDDVCNDSDSRCTTLEADAIRLSQQMMLYLFSKSMVKTRKMGLNLFNFEEDQAPCTPPRTGVLKRVRRELKRRKIV